MKKFPSALRAKMWGCEPMAGRKLKGTCIELNRKEWFGYVV